MNPLPIRTLILCVILPPFVYIFSLHFLETSVQSSYQKELAASFLGDTQLLFDGDIRVQDVIRQNVDAFKARKKLPAFGARIAVTVKTADGRYLYPVPAGDYSSDFNPSDSIVIARDNYEILNAELVPTVDVKIEHNTWISNIVLLICLGLSLCVLGVVYARALKKSRDADRATREIIDSLADEKEKNLERLARLEAHRSTLAEKTSSLQQELERQRRKTADTEEQMIDEMVSLEGKIGEHLKLQEQQQEEIEALQEKIARAERESEARSKQQSKVGDALRKRFNTLYKNLVVHERAIEGYLDLTEEMKIKAEEVIHQLNADSKKVVIKRKVFGKKNRETVFEVVFAYKGRLYFRNLQDRRCEVLVIGTKLTQNTDLAFLNKM